MDTQDKKEIEFKVSEYQEIIKKIENTALQTGITLEEGIKFLYSLSTSN